jgi:hypothetical protein
MGFGTNYINLGYFQFTFLLPCILIYNTSVHIFLAIFGWAVGTKIYVRNFARKHNVKGEVFAQTHREEGLLATGICVAVSPPLKLVLTFDSSINASHFDVPSCHSATLRPSLVRRNGILHPSFAFLLSSSCSCVVAL